MLSLLFVTGCSCSKKSSEEMTKTLEAQMNEYVTSFYEKNVKDYVNNINEQDISIALLNAADYDVSKLTYDGTQCDDTSFARIIIEDSTDVANSDYTIEYHLTCGSYSSEE